MNELIALRGTKADGRTIGAVPEQSKPMHVVGAPLRGPAHGFASTGAGAHCKNRRPAGAWTVLARVQAYVVHRTTNRLRLKVPSHKQDEAFFASLRQELLEQCGIVSVDVNPLTASVLIVHDGTLDLQPEEGQPGQHDASQVDVASRQGTGEPLSRDAALASLAIKLALVVITQQLSSPIVELWADALAQMVGHSFLQCLAHAATQPRQRLMVQSRR